MHSAPSSAIASPSPKPPSSPSRSPPKSGWPPAMDRDKEGSPADNELAHSLNHLSISTSDLSPAVNTASTSATLAAARSPRSPLKPTIERPPSINTNIISNSNSNSGSSSNSRSANITVPSTPRPGSSMRSPLPGPIASSIGNRTPTRSRSGTPTLLRKASMNSLHSMNGGAPSRRASSANVLSPGSGSAARSPMQGMSPEMAERPVATPESVASAHFKAELEVHHGANPNLSPETIVIIHDACYGHRFSRPRTSRAALNTIVERPERIKASVLGVSAAYVRLGERHQDGAFPIHPHLHPSSLPSVPFRIQKSTRRLSLTSQTVTNVHGTKWMEELKAMCESAEAKLATNGKELQRSAADRGPNGEPPKKLHEGDLYLCADSLEALEGALGGVCDAVDAVFRPQGPRRAFVAIRPPGHHCSASFPSGFCWVNNVHVGIMHGVLSHGLTHAAIIDFDLHHGDGSQSIAWEHNTRSNSSAKNAALWKKTSIGYFSLHDINSYPCEMGDEEKVKNASLCIENAHGQNMWNVHLQPWKTEADFWALYESRYSVLLEKMRNYLSGHAERLRASGLNSRAAIFLSAGFDASEWESAGMQRHNVNVPTDFYARLTRDVVRIAAEEGTSVEGRVISVLEGGYSDRALCSGIFSHICGLAGDGPATKEQDAGGLGYEMGQKMGKVRGRKDSTASERGSRRYETSWWSAAELEQLENDIATPTLVPIKPRYVVPPTYSSPTQASSAKALTPRVVRRTDSGLSPGRKVSPLPRYPTPPPPDVPWTVAAHELSKLLIPSRRQTDSCTPDDLNAEATRARRDRQSALTQSAPLAPGPAPAAPSERAPTRMALRERKAKAALPVDDEAEEERKNRRKTVAGSSIILTEKGKQRQSGRRLSAASAVVSDGAEPAAPAPLPAPIRAAVRPDTAQSIRPESSVSVRAANSNPITVKKTRGPAKKEPAPRRAPKKAPGTAVGGPSTVAKATKTTAAPSVAPASAPPSPPSTSKTDDDMEHLTSNMKNIKITLVTKAQREARERERHARELSAKGDAVPVASLEENKPMLHADQNHRLPSSPPQTATPVSTPPAEVADHHSGPSAHQQQYFPEHPAAPSTPALSHPSGFADAQKVPLPFSSPPGMSPTRGKQAAAGPSSPDMFVQYQPEGPAPAPAPGHANQHKQQQQQPPLQWLPPNTVSTPASAMRRADLPVFTATSAIPFALSPAAKKAQDDGGEAREIPETPQK
ncbi:hypothetical protein B0T22DRAFT_457130 [Podospora appendiculata]|uniref:Histone deacetylase domain-containing protein n=1 Tax=Podospora appendiculata TaxID=314037 RepID=A0AAE1CBC6_9PEZI|nr:hypothetical protein B0T22DRAFT_457130 [Podospora appendiculata]